MSRSAHQALLGQQDLGWSQNNWTKSSKHKFQRGKIALALQRYRLAPRDSRDCGLLQPEHRVRLHHLIGMLCTTFLRSNTVPKIWFRKMSKIPFFWGWQNFLSSLELQAGLPMNSRHHFFSCFCGRVECLCVSSFNSQWLKNMSHARNHPLMFGNKQVNYKWLQFKQLLCIFCRNRSYFPCLFGKTTRCLFCTPHMPKHFM